MKGIELLRDYRERALAAAEKSSGFDPSELQELFVAVRAGATKILVKLKDVEVVVERPPYVSVGGVPEFFRGVAYIDRKTVPIVRFPAAATSDLPPVTDGTVLVLVKEGHLVGFAVNEVQGLKPGSFTDDPQPVGRAPQEIRDFVDARFKEDSEVWYRLDSGRLIEHTLAA